jgi:hypothetical protein
MVSLYEYIKVREQNFRNALFPYGDVMNGDVKIREMM